MWPAVCRHAGEGENPKGAAPTGHGGVAQKARAQPGPGGLKEGERAVSPPLDGCDSLAAVNVIEITGCRVSERVARPRGKCSTAAGDREARTAAGFRSCVIQQCEDRLLNRAEGQQEPCRCEL
jgi:hypothetical protein